MPKLVDIDAFLPDDFEIRWRKETWTLPGDMPVETVLQLQQGFNQLQEANQAQDEHKIVAAFQSLANTVQVALALRQPERAQGLTFGARELGALALGILGALNVKSEEPASDQVSPGNAETAVS